MQQNKMLKMKLLFQHQLKLWASGVFVLGKRAFDTHFFGPTTVLGKSSKTPASKTSLSGEPPEESFQNINSTLTSTMSWGRPGGPGEPSGSLAHFSGLAHPPYLKYLPAGVKDQPEIMLRET